MTSKSKNGDEPQKRAQINESGKIIMLKVLCAFKIKYLLKESATSLSYGRNRRSLKNPLVDVFPTHSLTIWSK